LADPADSTHAPPPPPAAAAGTGVAAPDDTEGLDDAALTLAAPEVLADSLQEYVRAWLIRIRGGGSGALPIVGGLIVLVIFFQIEQSTFLTSGNIVNLLVQAAEFILFGVAELFALLLSEIDLSVGYTAAVGAFIIAELIAPPVNLPWWLAILAGIAATGAFGALQGTLITRLGLPSFVVTLGGLLFMNGVMLELANIDKTAVGGVINIDSNSPVFKLAQGHMSPALGWIMLAAGLAVFAAVSLSRASRRRSQGLSAPPIGITLLTIAVTAIGGIAVVFVCNLNRGALTPLKGVPWVVPFVILILVGVTWLLSRTRLGRYIYAIGANPEGARRAGINVARIRTAGFALCAMTAGLAGLAYESRLGSMSTSVQGGNLVLYAVAAAVIGGASLFGGRGKPLHALLGGVIIATVFNGLGLMGVSDAAQFIATAIVLIVAVTLDSVVRRQAAAGGVR
jgi:D-xylose transport system permease protein